jgi:hypothetical protein
MGEHRLHSRISAADYRVDGTDRMWSPFKERQTNLAEMDAHHVVVHTSMWGPNSGGQVPRSSAMFELFDVSGVEEIPAVFAGEVFVGKFAHLMAVEAQVR